MSPLNLKFGTGLDLEALEGGRWFELKSAPGLEVCLRYAENDAFRRERAEALVEHRVEAGQEPSEDDEAWAESLENDLFARHVLRDWRGPNVPTDAETGEPLDYTVERGVELLSDPRYPHVRAEIVRLAYLQRNFREQAVEELEEQAGNSSGDSSNETGANETSEN